MESSILPASKVAWDKGIRGIFYHYGRGQNLSTIAKSGDPKALFQNRLTGDTIYQGIHSGFDFYVAADPFSTTSFGPIRVKVYAKQDAKIFITTDLDFWNQTSQYQIKEGSLPDGYERSFTEKQTEHLNAITAELIANEPSLNTCEGQKMPDSYDLPILTVLALEQNKVGFNAYFGLLPDWFQAFGAWAIDHIELGNDGDL